MGPGVRKLYFCLNNYSFLMSTSFCVIRITFLKILENCIFSRFRSYFICCFCLNNYSIFALKYFCFNQQKYMIIEPLYIHWFGAPPLRVGVLLSQNSDFPTTDSPTNIGSFGALTKLVNTKVNKFIYWLVFHLSLHELLMLLVACTIIIVFLHSSN